MPIARGQVRPDLQHGVFPFLEICTMHELAAHANSGWARLNHLAAAAVGNRHEARLLLLTPFGSSCLDVDMCMWQCEAGLSHH